MAPMRLVRDDDDVELMDEQQEQQQASGGGDDPTDSRFASKHAPNEQPDGVIDWWSGRPGLANWRSERGSVFRFSRESKYPAYQPHQRSASFLVNRLSRQTLSPFGCLLLRTT